VGVARGVWLRRGGGAPGGRWRLGGLVGRRAEVVGWVRFCLLELKQIWVGTIGIF